MSLAMTISGVVLAALIVVAILGVLFDKTAED